jgi:hypothetical protein
MKYLSIKNFKEEKQQKVSVSLSMVDIKILHNACVDILNLNPEMIGYSEVMKKLSKIILKEQK